MQWILSMLGLCKELACSLPRFCAFVRCRFFWLAELIKRLLLFPKQMQLLFEIFPSRSYLCFEQRNTQFIYLYQCYQISSEISAMSKPADLNHLALWCATWHDAASYLRKSSWFFFGWPVGIISRGNPSRSASSWWQDSPRTALAASQKQSRAEWQRALLEVDGDGLHLDHMLDHWRCADHRSFDRKTNQSHAWRFEVVQMQR